jgi:hypothetical protein
MFDVEAYLSEKFPRIKRDGREAHVHCPFHGEDPGKRGRLYVNVDPGSDHYGLWDCKVCGETGNINQLRRYFGDPPIGEKEGTDYEPSDAVAEILDLAADYYSRKLGDNPDALAWLKERGLSVETIQRFKIGWADGSLRAHLVNRGYKTHEIIASGLMSERGVDFFANAVTIPYFRGGKCVQIRGRFFEGPAKYKTPAGAGVFLFNSDTTYKVAGTLVVCEGEFDAIIAEQNGFHAVGIPGVTSWKSKMKDWAMYFEMAPKIAIVFDGDTAGRNAAGELTKEFGPKSTVVEMEDDIDLSDWFKAGNTAEDFQKLLLSQSSGFLLTPAFAFERWDVEQADVGAQIPFGFPDIDDAMQKGMLPGQVLTVLAKTGAGKTAYILSAFEHIARQRPETTFLLYSLEQTASEWADRAWKVRRFYERINDPELAREDTKEFWTPRLRLVEKNRVTPDEFRQGLELYAAEMGEMPDMVAVDYLGYFARSFRGDAYERVTAAIMMLKEIAKEYRIRIMVPGQVSRGNKAGQRPSMDDARDSGAIEETSDFVLTYYRPDMLETGAGLMESRGLVNLFIAKSRHGGVGQEANCIFAPLSTAIVPSDGKNVSQWEKFAAQEVEQNKSKMKYEEAFQQSVAGERYAPVGDLTARRLPDYNEEPF